MDAEQSGPEQGLGQQEFRDNQGRLWDVRVNVSTVKRARRLLGIDIPALIAEQARPLGELLADDCRLVDLLYVLCKDQADAAGVSDEQFGEAMFGDAIFHGRKAFLRAMRDFFRDRRVREALGKMIDAALLAEEKILERLEQQSKKVTPEKIAVEMAATLQKRFGIKSTNAPGSSASTRVRTPTTS